MTQHDYIAAQAEFERIISTHPDYAGVTIHNDHPVSAISRAIRIADKLMQEPSEEIQEALWEGVGHDEGNNPDFEAVESFKAMRNQMLKEVE